MTFYWWSHWFWITLLASILLSVSFVHTYPSQEVSSEYNTQDVKGLKPVTKLYQATFTWSSTAATPSSEQYSSTGTTKLQSITPTLDAVPEMTNISNVDEMYDDESNSSDESEFKRSAEVFNKTHDGNRISEVNSDSKDPEKSEIDSNISEKPALKNGMVNNFTNFSSKGTDTAMNESATSVNNSMSPQSPIILSDSQDPNNTSTHLPSGVTAATPSTPNIESTNATASLLTGLPPPPANQTDSVASSSEVINAIDNPSDIVAHKVPFTLENVNKEDELRRAETDHRSRKSKVLSAEYRHINRYINYSTDSKNLLARSASTAPNSFDGDESNISSEALAIQRTYFLDAGAISAICFTVFGVCCTVGTIGIVLYRRRYLNKPQALSEPDSSVYIDDSTMRDNSDEMYSLDNDSFLNSLEAMTIQNYWTDTVKHTKL